MSKSKQPVEMQFVATVAKVCKHTASVKKQPIVEKIMPNLVKNLFAGIMGAAPCWVMTVLFIITWLKPMTFEEGRWVKLGVGIMVLEFILVHSGVFFAVFSQRWEKSERPIGRMQRYGIILLLLCFYTLFAVAFSFAFNTWTLFWIFLWVTASRLLTPIFNPEEGSRLMLYRSFISVVLYIFSAFLSVLVIIPRAGLTGQVLDRVYPDRGSGIWEQDPQQALLAGMVYFGILGLWELAAPFLADKHKPRNQKPEDPPQGEGL